MFGFSFRRPLDRIRLMAVGISISVGVSTLLLSCKKKPQVEEASSETIRVTPAESMEVSEAKSEEATMAETLPSGAPQTMISELGEFGSEEPVERQDLPKRGVLSFSIPMENRNTVFMPGEHWEQYNFPFEAKRWGRYRVRIQYSLKAPSLGVQLKMGDQRLKKQLKYTGGIIATAYMGEVEIPAVGAQFMALYTPPAVGWDKFVLQEITLIPTSSAAETAATEDKSESSPLQEEDGVLHLLAREAVTWSEKMRYEPKPEKDCLGFWTETEDFAEWEFKVEKAGKYEVIVHQGCGTGGGSAVAVELAGQQLEFKVEDTGGFQNWKPVQVGQVEIESAGTYRLAVKPKSKAKEDAAIMDVQKVVLVPVS